MYLPDPGIPIADVGIARTEANSLLLGWNHGFYPTGVELGQAEMGDCSHPVAVERDRHLVFWNRLLESLLRAQHLALGEMRKRAPRQCRQGFADQYFRACDVGDGRVSHFVHDTGRELSCQPALRLDRSRIQC
jgi:hypothetical protein